MTTTSQYITVRETAQLLGISEKKVMDLVEEKKLMAYRIAGQFLRLKKSEVMGMKNTGTVVQETTQHAYTPRERVNDFFYFNDYYLFCLAVIFGLLYVIFYV